MTLQGIIRVCFGHSVYRKRIKCTLSIVIGCRKYVHSLHILYM